MHAHAPPRYASQPMCHAAAQVIVILREPLQRAESLYNHWKLQEGNEQVALTNITSIDQVGGGWARGLDECLAVGLTCASVVLRCPESAASSASTDAGEGSVSSTHH